MLSWLSVLGVLLAGVAPVAPDAPLVVRQRVDMIELNHFVDDEGREVFRQIIFYDWSNDDRKYHVRAWRLVKKPSQLPQRRWDPPQYQCTWNDEGMLRQVWAPSMRETWTQRDPERVNRQLLPEDQRVPLWIPRIARRARIPAAENPADPTQAANRAPAQAAMVPPAPQNPITNPITNPRPNSTPAAEPTPDAASDR